MSPVPGVGDRHGVMSHFQVQEVCSTGMTPGREKSWTGRAAATYLAAEQTVNEEDEGSLQAVDDGEQVGHDTGYGSYLENAQHPGAPQDEELGKGLERQQPGREDLQRVRYWEGCCPCGSCSQEWSEATTP